MARPHANTWLLPALVALVAAALACAGAAAQQESADDALLPRIERGHFAALCRDLDLTYDQKLVVELIFDDYLAARAQAVQEIDARADEAGRRAVLDALAGRSRIDPVQLRSMQAAVLREYRRGIPIAFEQLDEMLAGVRGVLIDAQLRRFAAAERTMRRQVILQPRAALRLGYDYAGDGVDLVQLLAEADRTGGELHGVPAAVLSDIVTAYEFQMEALLDETALAELEGQIDRRIARLEGDAGALAEAEAAGMRRWRRMHALNGDIVRRIGDAISEHAGAEARQRWLDRFDEAAFPRLFAPTSVDRRYDWMSRQQLPDALRAEAETVYAGYVGHRRALAADAIRLMLRARSERGVILHSMSDASAIDGPAAQQLYQQLLRISGERSQLDRSAADALAALLDADQRARMRRATR